MNKEKEINRLFNKYKSNTITKEEYDILMDFIKDSQNYDCLDKAMDNVINLEEEYLFLNFDGDFDSDLVYDKLTERLENPMWRPVLGKRINSLLKNKSFFKIAATLALFLGLFSLLRNDFYEIPEVPYTISESESDNITLQLANGQIKIISEGGNTSVEEMNGDVIGKQVGNQLVYKNIKVPNLQKVEYNTLKVPYGKTFELLLSDGTKVMLNAGTSLKYPVNFIKGQDREVFLSGEAFFEVARDSTDLFVVQTNNIDVKVYGTKFNMSSYPEDYQSNVVLVEGSVSMSSADESVDNDNNILLRPGFMGTYIKENNNISLEKVDTDLYTSWMVGDMVFRHMTFENILKKLERKFDVKIINENQEIANDLFNASFHNVPIEKILEGLKGTYPIDFSIKDNIIIIN